MKLSIIIPIYNERKTISKVVEKASAVELPEGMDKEIIVVDDGSTDGSISSIRNQKSRTLKTYSHEKNLGKGAAIRTGLRYASGDLIIIQDADLEYDPSYYKLLLEPILESGAKVVYGSRLMSYPLNLWGKHKTVLPTHLIANKFLTVLTNILYGSNLTDMETGYKLFKREVLQKITLESKRFEFEPEITAKILKLKVPIMEIPIKVIPRTYEEGKKIGFKDGLLAIWTLIKYRF